MAFLLPLAEVAGTIAGTVGEAGAAFGLSESTAAAAGSYVGGQVAGKIGAAANETANNLATQAANKLGLDQTYNKVKHTVNQGNALLGSFLNDSNSGQAFGTTYRGQQRSQVLQSRTSGAPAPGGGSGPNGEFTVEDNNRLNAILAQKYLDLSRSGQIGCQNSQPGTSQQTPANGLSGVLPISGVKANLGSIYDSHVSASGISATQPTAGLNVSGNIVPNPSDVLTVSDILVTQKTPELSRKTGYDLGRFIATSSFGTAMSEDPLTTVTTAINDPESLNVVYQFTQFMSMVPDPSNNLEAVAQTYNGASINTSDVFIDDQGHFSIFDEIGTKQTYTGPSAPPNAGPLELLSLGFVKAIHGYWFGPKSENNHFPVDLVDTFAFMHDISYQDGWFNLVGDAQLISRLSSNMDRMGFIERQFAKVGIKWFSSVGLVLAKITNGLGPNPDKEVSSQPTQDIASFIDYQNTKSLPLTGSINAKGPDQFFVNNSVPDPVKKMEFYAGLREGVTDVMKSQMTSIGHSIAMNSDFSLLDDLIVDNLYD